MARTHPLRVASCELRAAGVGSKVVARNQQLVTPKADTSRIIGEEPFDFPGQSARD
jgi:hypothetical protein